MTIRIAPPSSSTILAARHLDASEGPVRVGSVVDAATRSAINRVLEYISQAHNTPDVAGEKGVTRRPCRYCPDPLCPEDCPECGGPIHDLDAVPAQHQLNTPVEETTVSAPLSLSAEQLRTIATVLNDLTTLTKTHGVFLTPHGHLSIGLGDNTLAVSWDGEAYVIDDRNGD